jgi:hypothetical protein
MRVSTRRSGDELIKTLRQFAGRDVRKLWLAAFDLDILPQ